MRYVQEIGGKKRLYSESELTERELFAIGRVTVQWADLEHGLFVTTELFNDLLKGEMPRDALSTSFARRLRVFKDLIEEVPLIDAQKKLLRKLYSKIANLQADRHRITHGLWDWDHSNPERISASSFRPNFEFEKSFNVEMIEDLAVRIGEVNFKLRHPQAKTLMEAMVAENPPDEDGVVAFGSISRLGAMALTGRLDISRIGRPTKGKHDDS